ncbi:MAG TPA: hypothetical protein P5572_04025 [Phycisphaerae bacterium]|nr:hypothetical protein [Phycisphaerae bacterium]
MLHALTIALMAAFAAAGPVRHADPIDPDAGPVAGPWVHPIGISAFLTGQGADPFALEQRGVVVGPAIDASGEIFWRTVENGPAGDDLWGASWDDLYHVDPPLAFDAPRRIVLPDALIARFASPRSVGLMVSSNAVLAAWTLEAEVEFTFEKMPQLASITTTGLMTALDADAVLLERTITVDTGTNGADVTFRARLVNTRLVLDFPQVVGATGATVFGSFRGVLTAPDPVAVVRLPIAGLTRAPDGRLVALSEVGADPHFHRGLYELTITPERIEAQRIAPVTNAAINAIEFDDDGGLWGAGDGLYVIDPQTGADTLVGPRMHDPIVDLDFAPNGRLYGTTFGGDVASTIVELAPGVPPRPLGPLMPAGPYWGLAIQ